MTTTTLHLLDAPEALFVKFSTVLPAGVSLTDAEADVYISFSGRMPDKLRPDARVWALAWGEGQPFISATLHEPASRANAVVDLHLIRRADHEWQTWLHAAFSTLPGRLNATLRRAEDRAIILILKALKNLDGEEPGVPFPYIMYRAYKPCPFWMRGKLLWRRWLTKISTIVLHESWMIGWVHQPIENATGWEELPPVEWIGVRSSERYLADPFLLPGSDATVLCEEFDFTKRVGVLKQMRVGGGEILDERDLFFPLAGHLSYPFVFQHQGETYCLPESSAAYQLILFRWNAGAGKWENHAAILEGVEAADATLFVYGGMFWVAYTDIAIDAFDNLNLIYAASLEGPWRAHSQNPVVLDPRVSRCGGTIFEKEGKLIRPAQDCSERYGGAIRLMRIDICTQDQFLQTEITLIRPEKALNPHGFHTLSAAGDKTLVDGKRMMFSPGQTFGKIGRRLKIMR